jgi:hypothetical protein
MGANKANLSNEEKDHLGRGREDDIEAVGVYCDIARLV